MRFDEQRDGGSEGLGVGADAVRTGLPDGPPAIFADGQSICRSPSASDGVGRVESASAVEKSASTPSDGRRQGAQVAEGRMPSSEGGEGGHRTIADRAKEPVPPSPLISQLAELQYRRKFYIGLVNKQTNAAKSLARRMLGWRYDAEEGDRKKLNDRAARIVAAAIAGKEPKAEDAEVFNALAMDLAVTAAAIEPCQKARDHIEKDMRRLARGLPVYPWAKAVHGFGELGLAVLVGEAGDIGSYPKKGHLWKRLGLAPHDGKAYSTWRRDGGLTADDWVAAGYSPRRRAEVFAVISEPLFRQQSVVAGPYRARYDARRARTAELHPDWTKAHSHADGLRVMTKYLLRDLWQEWRRVSAVRLATVLDDVPAAEPNRGKVEHGASQSTAKAGLPSSDSIRQPDAGSTNEQEAMGSLPSAAIRLLPTARPIRRKAKDVVPQADAAQPSDDEQAAGRAEPQTADVLLPPARNKRRNVTTEASPEGR